MDGILPPTTRHKSWLQLIAEAYEKEHGPLPDPVSTAGSFLVTAPKTPVASYDMVGFDDEFVAILEEKLNGILWHQKLRRNLFGPVADTFPIGHTPPGFREPYFAERDKPIDTDSEDDDSPETQRILQKFSIIRTMKRVAMPRSPGFDKRNAKAKKRKVEDIRVREDLRVKDGFFPACTRHLADDEGGGYPASWGVAVKESLGFQVNGGGVRKS